MKPNKIQLVFVVLLALALGVYLLLQTPAKPIGGERDAHGCLTPAGYSFNEDVGACLRVFEMTPDILQAAKIAVESVGQGYALTVVSFNSFEEPGAYDIVLERGEERTKETVYIRQGEAVAPKNVQLFYYDPAKDRDASGNVLCSRQGLVAIERAVSPDSIVEDVVRLLLKGEITEGEAAQGVSSEYPLEGLSLVSAELAAKGVLTLTFDDAQNKTVGGACRVGVLWFQIEATALQFPGVASVTFMPEELFQP
jgi:hypothetical protein